jgi:hypothetical protein
VHVEGAEWLRIAFNAVELAGNPDAGTGAILRITSFADGAVQELNAVHLAEWQYTSAYFNGDTVQIDVEAQPNTGASRVVLGRAWAGIGGGTKSQCGATDDRVLSSDARQGRALPIGCTAWLFDDCKHCMGTAGHCSTSSLQVIEFNVPLSTATGALNHPSPDDQYAVDVSSKQSQNSGIGLDWGYFGVFANSNTGLFPYQKQAALVSARHAARRSARPDDPHHWLRRGQHAQPEQPGAADEHRTVDAAAAARGSSTRSTPKAATRARP